MLIGKRIASRAQVEIEPPVRSHGPFAQTGVFYAIDNRQHTDAIQGFLPQPAKAAGETPKTEVNTRRRSGTGR